MVGGSALAGGLGADAASWIKLINNSKAVCGYGMPLVRYGREGNPQMERWPILEVAAVVELAVEE